MSQSDQQKPVGGGLKGFFQRAYNSFEKGGLFAKDWSLWAATKGARIGLFLASTSMVVLMPLIFEINREVTMIEGERVQVAELRNQGMSDRQLQEMGYLEVSLHTPSVAGGMK